MLRNFHFSQGRDVFSESLLILSFSSFLSYYFLNAPLFSLSLSLILISDKVAMRFKATSLSIFPSESTMARIASLILRETYVLQYVYPYGPVTHICPVAHNFHNTCTRQRNGTRYTLRVCTCITCILETLKRRKYKLANVIFDINFSYRHYIVILK